MKRINLYFKDNAYTNATGDPSTAWHSIYLNEEALICCLFKDAANAGIDLSAGTLEYASDKDYKHEGDPMLYAFGLTNVPAWSDPANGKVAFTVSAFNAAFAAKLGADATREMVCQIKQLFEGGESVIASFKMNAVNIVHLNQGEPEPGAVGYYTAAQVDAIAVTKANIADVPVATRNLSDVSSAAPAVGQVLVWDATAGEYVPTTLPTGVSAAQVKKTAALSAIIFG